MTPIERLHDAFRSPSPAQVLRSTVLSLAAEGQTQASVYALLEQLLLAVRASGKAREADEDLILDLMDGVNGWCHPSARLFAEEERR